MSTNESKYIPKHGYLSRYSHERTVALRETTQLDAEAEWFPSVQKDLPKFIPFLTRKCGLEFRGRILEIGAGGAWLSAELSKLPVQSLDVLDSKIGDAGLLVPDARGFHSRSGEGGRRFENLGRHPLSDGQRRRCAARQVRCPALHFMGAERRIAVILNRSP